MTIADKLTQIAENTPKVYEAGKAEGIEQGKQAEYDAFWDACQENGKRSDYQYAFAYFTFNDDNFKPKYDMILKPGYGGAGMFTFSPITNIAEALERQGVRLDTSKNGIFDSMFNQTKTVRVPELNLTSATSASYMFIRAKKLVTIDKLIIAENVAFNSSFNECESLENLIIEGTLAQNGLNLQWSTKLSKASIESIINALSTTTSGLNITLSQTAVNNAFSADEWAALKATRANWTINLV